MSFVYAVVNDLFFGDRIGNALQQLGYQSSVVDLSLDTAGPIPPGVNLVLADLEAGDAALETIRAAQARALPVLAFGPHTDLALREAALQAGATRVVAKSKLTSSFAELVADMLK